MHDESDRERIQRWVQQYGRAVRGYIGVLVGNAFTADDIWQDVFRRAWRARQNYREQGTAKAYLFRIADHLVCDHFRKQRPEVQLDDDTWQQWEPTTNAEAPDAALERTETHHQLEDALAQLKPDQRRVLLLRYFGQLSFNEIAETMHCPLGTVLSNCHRALKKLRGLMAECLP